MDLPDDLIELQRAVDRARAAWRASGEGDGDLMLDYRRAAEAVQGHPFMREALAEGRHYQATMALRRAARES